MQNGGLMLVAIVGIDGSGKSTQIEMLKNSELYTVNSCKAVPNNRNIIENLSFEDYVTYKQTLSFAMALDLISAYNNQMIEDNATINIWDRYKYCIHAYFMAEHISYEKTHIVLNQIKTPDLTIWLKIDPKLAEKRIHSRGIAKPGENEKFLSLIHECYESVLKDADNVYELDCKERSANEIHEEIMSTINRCLF